MRATCTQLSDVSEQSEECCSTRQEAASIRSCTGEETRIPLIDIDSFDEAPFSESFSGMLDFGDIHRADFKLANDISYHIDQITGLQEIDSDWEDDDIDEIVIISRKIRTVKTKIQDARDQKELDKVFSISEFDFINAVKNSSGITSGTHVVRKRDTNRVYTVKAFRATPSLSWPFELRLLETLTELSCPFLPCILRRIFERQSLFVLLDLYPAGNMLDYVLREGPLDPDEVLFYSSEIAEAISVLHDVKVEHRDINPANVMIDTDGHIVLSGFDFARINDSDPLFNDNQNQRLFRDHEYRAPEIILLWDHDFLVDCWGLGGIMYFMSFGKHPFPVAGFTQAQVYKQVLRGESPIVTNDGRMGPAAMDIMLKCLERNPRLRPSIAEIKRHKYFISIDWAKIQEKKFVAPYVPSIICDTPCQVPTTLPATSLDGEITTIAQTPSAADCDSSKSRISKPESVYSLQARHSVKDLLPNIFRSPSLDELKMNANQSRLTEEYSVSKSDSSITDRAPSYESLRHGPVVNKLGRGGRSASFWDSIDKDVNAEAAAPKPARVLGIRLSSSEPRLQESLSAAPKLRGRQSSISGQSNHRLSQLVSLSILGRLTQNKLRNLRRPKSTPAFSHSDVIMRSGTKLDEYELPNGIKQIGSGIGFTYKVPAASRSKPSICTPAGVPRRSHSTSIMPAIGSGIGLGLRTFGGGILRSKRLKQERQDRSEYAQPLSDGDHSMRYEPQGLCLGSGMSKMNSVREDVDGEVEAEQDVFRYGSTYSLMPEDVCRVPASPCSPATATDSTIYSPLSGF